MSDEFLIRQAWKEKNLNLEGIRDDGVLCKLGGWVFEDLKVAC